MLGRLWKWIVTRKQESNSVYRKYHFYYVVYLDENGVENKMGIMIINHNEVTPFEPYVLPKIKEYVESKGVTFINVHGPLWFYILEV